jgi:hypothetical protein
VEKFKRDDLALISTYHQDGYTDNHRWVEVIHVRGRLYHRMTDKEADYSVCGRYFDGATILRSTAHKVLAPCTRCWKGVLL